MKFIKLVVRKVVLLEPTEPEYVEYINLEDVRFLSAASYDTNIFELDTLECHYHCFSVNFDTKNFERFVMCESNCIFEIEIEGGSYSKEVH